MSAPGLILIGGGEHARVVADAARSQPGAWELLGFVDPQPCPELEARFGVVRLADDAAALALAPRAHFVLAIGRRDSAPLRRRLVARYEAGGARWATVRHATAWVSPSANIDPGTVILAGAMVQTGAMLGAHVVVNTGAIVEHDTRVGDFTQLAPAAVTGGGVEIGADSYLGLGCRVRDHVQLGTGVTVGMGAVVTRSVPDGQTVLGVPARVQES
jgi:acetyltransferase EpsM